MLGLTGARVTVAAPTHASLPLRCTARRRGLVTKPRAARPALPSVATVQAVGEAAEVGEAAIKRFVEQMMEG